MTSYDFETAKKKYRELCRTEASVNVYMRDWYLDAVVEKKQEWLVVLVEENEVIMAAFPFGYMKRHGMNYISNLWQSVRMGLWIRKKIYKSKEDELRTLDKYVEEVVTNLPPYDSFKVAFHGGFKNWQPFYWRGFSAVPYYSMLIKGDGEDYISHIGRSRRNRIRKAAKMYRIEANQLSLEEYWEFLLKTYDSKAREVAYDKTQFFNLLEVLQNNNACIIWSVYDNQDNLVSACITLEDAGRCYHQFVAQMQGQDTDATSYAVYEAIKYTLDKDKIFDFEGSMIRGVCEFNASFNPDREVYYVISKFSRKYRLFAAIKDIINIIFKR